MAVRLMAIDVHDPVSVSSHTHGRVTMVFPRDDTDRPVIGFRRHTNRRLCVPPTRRGTSPDGWDETCLHRDSTVDPRMTKGGGHAEAPGVGEFPALNQGTCHDHLNSRSLISARDPSPVSGTDATATGGCARFGMRSALIRASRSNRVSRCHWQLAIAMRPRSWNRDLYHVLDVPERHSSAIDHPGSR